MSWKGRNYPVVVSSKPQSKMIEHSINKYPVSHFVPYNEKGNFTTKYWNKHECEIYIEQLAKRGYVVDAPIKTKYGFYGKIQAIRDIPDTGINFTEQQPNIFIIQKYLGNAAQPAVNNLLYGEHELELLPVITTKGTLPC